VGGALTEEATGSFMDLRHCTVLPGLVDSHAHVAFSGTEDPSLRRRQIQAPSDEAWETIQENLRQHWRHAVMAVRDGGDREAHALKYSRQCVGRGNEAVRLFSPGSAWHAESRYGRFIGRPPTKNLGLARSIRKMGKGADYLKIINSGPNSLTEFGRETLPQFSPGELFEAVEAAHALGLKVMAHANGRLPVKLAIEAGVSSIEHGYFMGGENLRALAERGIAWVPTAFAMEALSCVFGPGSLESETGKRNLAHQLEQIRLARELGVVMALGTDAGSAGVHHGQALLEEMRLFRAAGLSWEEVVRCTTGNGAHLVGLEQEIGTLAPGMPATFVAVRGGPEGMPGSLASPEGVFFRGERIRQVG
jgi:imidazolonepropionase-like amidohydrolase